LNLVAIARSFAGIATRRARAAAVVAAPAPAVRADAAVNDFEAIREYIQELISTATADSALLDSGVLWEWLLVFFPFGELPGDELRDFEKGNHGESGCPSAFSGPCRALRLQADRIRSNSKESPHKPSWRDQTALGG
jgi:hypothetical protein